jgi:hypothetical protein
MTGDDIIAVDTIRRDRHRRGVMGLGVPVGILAVGFLAYVIFNWHDILRIALPAAAAGVLSFRPWRTLPALQRQLAALGMDEASGDVLICKGVGGELLFALDEEHRLQPAVLVRGARDEALTVEVLPRSGAVLSVNGKSTHTWSEMQRGTTAPKSAHARAAANFVRDVAGRGETALAERMMTPEELAELATHAPMLSRIDLLLATSCSALAVVSWWHAVKTESPTLVLPVVSSAAAMWLIFRAYSRWKSHRRFAPDMVFGRIVIVQQLQDGIVAGPSIEYLPMSGAVWSCNHQPAPWRRLALARGTYVRRSGA